MYLEFDKTSINSIPSDATINSVTANVRYYVNNTTYVSAVSIQLYTNTSAKGDAVTNRPTTSTKYAITPGSWTLNELKNVRLYISATHNASTSSGYLYLYGADVTIDYTADQPTTTIPFRVKRNGSWVTPTKVLVKRNNAWVEPTDIKVKSGGSWH